MLGRFYKPKLVPRVILFFVFVFLFYFPNPFVRLSAASSFMLCCYRAKLLHMRNIFPRIFFFSLFLISICFCVLIIFFCWSCSNIYAGLNFFFFFELYLFLSFDLTSSNIHNSSGGTLNIVQSLNMLDPTLVWEETVAYPIDSNGYQYKTLNYSTQYSNGVKLLMMYDYFAQPHFVDYPYLNASRTLPADSFKGSIRISVRKKKKKKRKQKKQKNYIPFVLDSAFVILFFSRC